MERGTQHNTASAQIGTDRSYKDRFNLALLRNEDCDTTQTRSNYRVRSNKDRLDLFRKRNANPMYTSNWDPAPKLQNSEMQKYLLDFFCSGKMGVPSLGPKRLLGCCLKSEFSFRTNCSFRIPMSRPRTKSVVA